MIRTNKYKIRRWYTYEMAERIEAQCKYLEWSDLEKLLSIIEVMRSDR